MQVFNGSNPTQLYRDTLTAVLSSGEECKPRGKLVKEIRPACVEFTQPTNRVTFLNARRINPFFQLAEALWIISGRSDVAFLEAFNKNMKTFSDDGRSFNASYGERIRFFTKNDLHGIVINPVDQLEDAFLKLKADHDTRQAVIVISNPLFDNYKYTVLEKGKDIACLTGDTIISSPEGDIRLDEIVQRDGYPVYSFNETTKTVEIQRVTSGGLTRRNAKLIQVTLGDGTKIKATPDHIFYKKLYNTVMEPNKSGVGVHPVKRFESILQVRCDELSIGDILPYLFRYNDGQGYKEVSTKTLSRSIPTGRESVKEHVLYKEFLDSKSIPDGYIVHHKNHNRQDNSEHNLEILLKSEHDALDMSGNKHQQGTKKSRANSELLTKDSLFRISQEIVKSGVNLTVETFQNAFDGVGCLSACKKHYGTFKAMRSAVYGSLGITAPNGLSGSVGNYKSTTIVSIEELNETENVYDITVDGNHNFFANGFLVHNCNLVITFKIRNEALNITVFNRSNDLHWGLFGANLAQFSTIQELMASWLGVKVGTYTHITDSLHVYLDDYGCQISDEVEAANPKDKVCQMYKYDTEPRMNISFENTDIFLSGFWGSISGNLLNDQLMTEHPMGLAEAINIHTNMKSVADDYWMMTMNAMIVYRLVRLGKWAEALEILQVYIPASQWKTSMMYFLKSMLKSKMDKAEQEDVEYFTACGNKYMEIIENLIPHLISGNEEALREYLKL